MGGWPAGYLQSVDELNSGPKTNPSGGRKPDLNPGRPSSALTPRPRCLHMIFHIFICIFRLLQVYHELTIGPEGLRAQLINSTGIAQRTWVQIPFRHECFSGFNLTTVCITAMINHVFTSFLALVTLFPSCLHLKAIGKLNLSPIRSNIYIWLQTSVD